MSTNKPVQSSTPQPATKPFANALAFVQHFLKRLAVPAAPAAPGTDTSDLWQLYRMSRGSDSLRPAVFGKLASGAGR